MFINKRQKVSTAVDVERVVADARTPSNCPEAEGFAMPVDSTTPLVRKLGISSPLRIYFVNAPPSFSIALGPLPLGVELLAQDASDRHELNVIIFFARNVADLREHFAELKRQLAPNGGLWVAWPKKAFGVETDLSDNVVRNFGLKQGLVDNKVCSIDDTWSAQRFVIRVKDRPKPPGPKKR
jgi:hypothetical protein